MKRAAWREIVLNVMAELLGAVTPECRRKANESWLLAERVKG